MHSRGKAVCVVRRRECTQRSNTHTCQFAYVTNGGRPTTLRKRGKKGPSSLLYLCGCPRKYSLGNPALPRSSNNKRALIDNGICRWHSWLDRSVPEPAATHIESCFPVLSPEFPRIGVRSRICRSSVSRTKFLLLFSESKILRKNHPLIELK